MCNPTIIETVSDDPIAIIQHISLEINKGRSCLFMEPKLINSTDEGEFLIDVEANCKHGAEHLLVAQKLIDKLNTLLEIPATPLYTHQRTGVHAQRRTKISDARGAMRAKVRETKGVTYDRQI